MAHDPIQPIGETFNQLLKSNSRGSRLAVQRSAALPTAPRSERNDLLPAIELVYRDSRHLKKPTRNVRKRDSTHVREVANSIAAFGFIDPHFIDEADNVLDGVIRVEGAILHGLQKIPCIVAGHLTSSHVVSA